MINNDRIVPITKVDFLTVIGIILAIANVSYAVAKSSDTEGDFEITASGAAGNKLCDQPLKSLDFKSGTTSGTVYFVPSYDFEGFKVAGSDATLGDDSLEYDEIEKDGITLYKAVLGSNKVTISAVSPIAS